MVLSGRYKGDAFRLAAVLYVDNNYEVTPRTILRKIIESIFLENDNVFLSTDNVIDQIQDRYEITYSEEEVKECINSNLEDHFLVNKKDDGSYILCLEIKRLELLRKKLNHKNIDYFIDEFLKLNATNFEGVSNGKEVIYRFLYEGFLSNISSFTRLLDSDFDLKTFIENLNHNFDLDEAKLINSFLKWDESDKNKCVFDISCFALEYCLITNNKSSSVFELNNLKNKNFYLDTNVIFRAIGINGDTRKRRTLTFLDKFSDAQEKLIITKFSDTEFRATIDHYISELGRFSKGKRIGSEVFLEYSSNKDIYHHYFEWRSKRANNSLELYRASILSTYEALIRKYNIKLYENIPINVFEEDTKKDIDQLIEDIYAGKRLWARNPENVNYSSIHYDAKNIYLIAKERGEATNDIFQAKHFYISTDQLLKKWDLERETKTPIVILPSHWMTILLKYYSRTNDDFKSFVSFISLSQNGSSISNRTLANVLKGISEITEDVSQQSRITKVLVENKFNDIINENSSVDEIADNARNYTENLLEKELAEQRKAISDLSGDFKKQEEKIKKLQASKKNDSDKLDKYQKIIIDGKLKKYSRLGYLFLFGVILGVIILLLLFIYQDSSWNHISKLKNWCNSLKEDSLEKSIAFALSYAIPVGLIAYCFSEFNKRLCSKEKKNEKKETYTKELLNEN
ncbi:hypothetical protein [Ascidiimonas aurantiaca]|uniref:hypothetical protein n=1 Tax=Ascidiimonas aurantiaca TaxID=1685432 RepID=UPI0030EB6C18